LQELGTLLQYQGRISFIRELSPFLYRDRSRMGPEHPTRIYFHPLQLTSLVFMKVLLVDAVETILELFL
jgi:hypothetical protein